jgi:hypothetical protein
MGYMPELDEDGMVVVTEELLRHGATNPDVGAWNKRQFEALGVPWPLKSGWKAALLGTRITPDQASAFLDLRNVRNVGAAYSGSRTRKAELRARGIGSKAQ